MITFFEGHKSAIDFRSTFTLFSIPLYDLVSLPLESFFVLILVRSFVEKWCMTQSTLCDRASSVSLTASSDVAPPRNLQFTSWSLVVCAISGVFLPELIWTFSMVLSLTVFALELHKRSIDARCELIVFCIVPVAGLTLSRPKLVTSQIYLFITHILWQLQRKQTKIAKVPYMSVEPQRRVWPFFGPKLLHRQFTILLHTLCDNFSPNGPKFAQYLIRVPNLPSPRAGSTFFRPELLHRQFNLLWCNSVKISTQTDQNCQSPSYRCDNTQPPMGAGLTFFRPEPFCPIAKFCHYFLLQFVPICFLWLETIFLSIRFHGKTQFLVFFGEKCSWRIRSFNFEISISREPPGRFFWFLQRVRVGSRSGKVREKCFGPKMFVVKMALFCTFGPKSPFLDIFLDSFSLKFG